MPATSSFPTPEAIYPGLFEALQHSRIWPDDKALADAVPKQAPSAIMDAYQKERLQPDFDLKTFFDEHFHLPESPSSGFVADVAGGVVAHIERLWDVLQRKSDEAVEGSSLIPLPFPYIVPGGRFNEIYYWDSYFTMLGLKVSGEIGLIKNMVNNFAWLIDHIGFIPNGNRSYFTGRSQPPFFALMVELLHEALPDEGILTKYLPQLAKEHAFWMDGQADLQTDWQASKRVVQTPYGVLNRYYDAHHKARAEMFATDEELLAETGREAADFFLHVRAACESGWDFSSRWFADGRTLATIEAAHILPVDLNSLLWQLETTLARAHAQSGDADWAKHFSGLAAQRAQAIQHLFWNETIGYYVDYQFVSNTQLTQRASLAGVFPLFFGLASTADAAAAIRFLLSNFLRPGGFVTTSVHSGQQWDAPNGWAPLQWMAHRALLHYGYQSEAAAAKQSWVDLNVQVFENTGKLLEKYNVEDTSLLSGGGEYPVQDGFGWTNGVLLAMRGKD